MPSWAQRANDLARLEQYCERGRIDVTAPADARTSKTLSFPVRMLPFGFLSNAISEQISADCAFDLSCSTFSAAAIDRFGFVKGAQLTGDRLTRCHLFVGQETVPMLFNNRTGKVIDEPSMY